MFFFYTPEDTNQLTSDVRRFLERDTLTWTEMEHLLIAFRELRSDLTVGALITFLYIARRTAPMGDETSTNLTITDVAEKMSLSYPTAARHCDLLSGGVRGKRGLGWLRKESTTDLRFKCVLISDEGISVLANAIASIAAE